MGQSDADCRGICLATLHLCIDFCDLKKANSHYWSNFVQNESRTREVRGYAASYQRVTQNNISSAKRMVEYAKLTVGWSRIEIPLGCYSELPPVFSH